jgi:hypothetical protein
VANGIADRWAARECPPSGAANCSPREGAEKSFELHGIVTVDDAKMRQLAASCPLPDADSRADRTTGGAIKAASTNVAVP